MFFQEHVQVCSLWVKKFCNFLRVQVEFSTTTYNALLDVCARSGEIYRAEPLLKQMADQGWADCRLHSICHLNAQPNVNHS